MAKTVQPRIDPLSGGGPGGRPPIDDERELLETGTQGIPSNIAKQPILGSYLPVNPVQRFTFKKWDTDDWSRHNENKFFQANRDRETSKVLRDEAKELIAATERKSNTTQNDVTEKLGERVQNINYWKFELERGIQDITAENDLMITEIRRLEHAIQATEIPTHIARDCLGNRQRRIDTDLVQDDAENQLLKELQLISQVKDTLIDTLNQAKTQLVNSREAKHRLEMDWSDKVDAGTLDSKNSALKNTRGNIMHRAGQSVYKEMESMPPNWQEFSQENLRHSNQERETSMRLRGVIGQTLSQTSQDMREQADRCEEALSRRVSESEEATRGLEDQLKQTVDEIAQMENSIYNLDKGRWDKEAPMKVSETRLFNRHARPNVEMCRDETSHRLLEEVSELEDSMRQLELKNEQSEGSLRDMQHTRLALEKEIDIKRNSIMLDRERCLRIRGLFPSTNLLSGYRNRIYEDLK